MEHDETKAMDQAETMSGLSWEELEAQAVAELPDREAMSVINPSSGAPAPIVGSPDVYLPIEPISEE